MISERISAMLETCSGRKPFFPPTDLYNEGWMLRLVLDWYSTYGVPGHALTVPAGSRWYCEALLPSPFPPRYRGDKAAESWTYADGVIGQFTIGVGNKAGLSLSSDTTHLVVLEGKMSSSLSAGVKNAPYYDQSARTVACMAEAICRGLGAAGRKSEQMTIIGFYVLAPRSQIGRGSFDAEMSTESIRSKVEQRAREYGKDPNWLSNWFEPMLQKIDIRPIAWDDLITEITQHDQAYGKELAGFYEKCIGFNGTIG